MQAENYSIGVEGARALAYALGARADCALRLLSSNTGRGSCAKRGVEPSACVPPGPGGNRSLTALNMAKNTVAAEGTKLLAAALKVWAACARERGMRYAGSTQCAHLRAPLNRAPAGQRRPAEPRP